MPDAVGRRGLLGGPALRRFVPVTLAMPVLASVLGIDGGAIFQIFASEDLGLSSTAIGVAFGLGVVSLPVQVWAARLPLWRARRNLQLFLVIAAVQAWVLAALVVSGSTGGVAAVALGITVSAEVSLSVLYATAWQPLLSHALASTDRQQLNARFRAAGSGLLALALVILATLDRGPRVVFLVVVGMVAVALAVGLRRIAAPDRPGRAARTTGTKPPRQPVPAGVRSIYVVIALANVSAWPLLLIYVHDVLAPEANLGVIGALQLVGSLAASLAWRPTVGALLVRARVAGLALVVAGFVLAALRSPVDQGFAEAALLSAVVVAAAATTVLRLSLLELAHRSIDDSVSVRAFTLLDVVASSSLQLGLLAAGFLVAASTTTTGWIADPYRLFVIACTTASLVAILRLPNPPPDQPATPNWMAPGVGKRRRTTSS